MALSNKQLWNYLRNKYPKFKSETSEGTNEMFTEQGYSQLKQFNQESLNDFFQLSMRVFLNKIDVANVKDLLSDQGFGEAYDQPWGGYLQRIAVENVKPVSPAFKNLANGKGPDPFVVRKGKAKERFFPQNFDYQSLITQPDDFAFKQLFVAENGMSEFAAAQMKAMQNGYVLQVYNNKLECINAVMHSVDYPLQDTQKYGIDITSFDASGITTADAETPFASQWIGFIQLVRNIVDGMVYTPATGAFNQAGFVTTQDKDRLKILVRPTIANAISAIMKLNNADDMGLPIDVIKVPDFGGLEPYKEAGYTTKLYPVYDDLGTVIGYNELADQTVVTVEENKVFWKVPNENILAIIADKGVVFTTTQNPYNVEPIRNPRGLYTNYWASSVNNGVLFDTYYNFVTIENTHNAQA